MDFAFNSRRARAFSEEYYQCLELWDMFLFMLNLVVHDAHDQVNDLKNYDL